MNKVVPIPINLAVEDILSEAVLRHIICGIKIPYAIGICLMRNGQSYLRSKISNFNLWAKGTPLLLLTDLDDEECPPKLLSQWFTFPKHANFIFRVAVKEVETWLLADRINFANYLGVTSNKIPSSPESISTPKEFIINLARKSRFRSIRDDLIPKCGARFGRNYNNCLIKFVVKEWDFKLAARISDSLERTLNTLKSFRPTWASP